MAKTQNRAATATVSLSPRDASDIAIDYFKQLYDSPYTDLAVEELTRDDEFWEVTLGYNPGRFGMNGVLLPMPGSERRYKKVRVKDADASVQWMKIQNIA